MKDLVSRSVVAIFLPGLGKCVDGPGVLHPDVVPHAAQQEEVVTSDVLGNPEHIHPTLGDLCQCWGWGALLPDNDGRWSFRIGLFSFLRLTKLVSVF